MIFLLQGLLVIDWTVNFSTNLARNVLLVTITVALLQLWQILYHHSAGRMDDKRKRSRGRPISTPDSASPHGASAGDAGAEYTPPAEISLAQASAPKLSYWEGRRLQGQSSSDPPTRSPQKLSSQKEPGPGHWEKMRLEGYSAAARPTLSPTTPQKLRPPSPDFWGLTPPKTPALLARQSLLESYPRATEEEPYKQKNILRPPAAVVARPADARRKTRGRRRSARQGGTQAGKVSSCWHLGACWLPTHRQAPEHS